MKNLGQISKRSKNLGRKGIGAARGKWAEPTENMTFEISQNPAHYSAPHSIFAAENGKFEREKFKKSNKKWEEPKIFKKMFPVRFSNG